MENLKIKMVKESSTMTTYELNSTTKRDFNIIEIIFEANSIKYRIELEDPSKINRLIDFFSDCINSSKRIMFDNNTRISSRTTDDITSLYFDKAGQYEEQAVDNVDLDEIINTLKHFANILGGK